MKKIIITIAIMLLISINIVMAEQTTSERVNLNDLEYKQLLIEQSAKTNQLIIQELNKRDAAIEKRTTELINANFEVLDNRINDFIKKAAFKLGMIFFSGMVLGGTVLFLIQNALNRKRAITKKLSDSKEQLILKGQTLQTIKKHSSIETINNDDEQQTINELEEKKKLLEEEIQSIDKELGVDA